MTSTRMTALLRKAVRDRPETKRASQKKPVPKKPAPKIKVA